MHQPLADCSLTDLFEDTGIFPAFREGLPTIFLQMSSLVVTSHPSPMAVLVSCLDEHKFNNQEKFLQKAFWWLPLPRNRRQISRNYKFCIDHFQIFLPGPHTLQRKSLFKVRSAPQCASLRSSSLKPLQTRGDTEGQKQTNGTASHEQQHSLFPAQSTRGTPAVPLMRCQAGTQHGTRAQL